MDPASGPNPSTQDPARLAPGTMIGRYRILEFRGRGGMGEVYLAEDDALHRRVALKRVVDRSGIDTSQRDRILREARRASRLSDPRIASVHDVLEHAGEVFLVMEFVDGISLREEMTGALPLERFWTLAIECTTALDVAHRAGVVHRDIKPDNIMITRTGQVKILDFGIARRVGAGESETTTLYSPDEDRIAGTPAYMPPEAHLGGEPDVRTDIFSLGVFFYELLAGRRPFAATSRAALVTQILHQEPERLDTLRPELSPALAALVGRMLAKDPRERPASTVDVLDGLLAARRGEPAPLAPEPRSPQYRPWGVAAGALLLLAAGVWALFGGGEHLLIRLGLRGLPIPRHLAVLPFSVTGEDTDKSAFGLGLADALTTVLASGADASSLVVEPMEEVDEELRDILSEKAGRIDSDVSSAAKAKLGINLVLAGRVEKYGDSLDVVMELRDPSTGSVLRRARRSATLDRFQEFPELALGLLGIQGSASPTPLPVSGPYLHGMGKLRAAGDSLEIQEAIQEFRLALDMMPDDPVTTAELSRAYLAMHRVTKNPDWLQAAVAAGRRAVELGREQATAHKALGLALSRARSIDGARVALETAALLDPTDDEAYYEYARSYGRRGDYSTQDSLFTAAIRRRPQYWRTHWWRATSLYHQGRLEEAIAPFRRAAELAPDLYKNYTNLCAIHLTRGEYADALQAAIRSAQLNPSSNAYSNLGTAQFYSRRFDEAAANYRRALEYDKENHAVWINLGDTYHWGYGKPEEAAGAYRNAVAIGEREHKRRPYDLVLLADLAAVQPKLGQADSARARIERVLTDPGSGANPFVLYNAALIYWQLLEPDRALAHLEQAIASGYPPPLIRDSVIFDDWREDPRFRALFPPVFAESDSDSS